MRCRAWDEMDRAGRAETLAAVNRQIAAEIAATRMNVVYAYLLTRLLPMLAQAEEIAAIRGPLASCDRAAVLPVYVLSRRLRKAVKQLLKQHAP